MMQPHVGLVDQRRGFAGCAGMAPGAVACGRLYEVPRIGAASGTAVHPGCPLPTWRGVSRFQENRLLASALPTDWSRDWNSLGKTRSGHLRCVADMIFPKTSVL